MPSSTSSSNPPRLLLRALGYPFRLIARPFDALFSLLFGGKAKGPVPWALLGRRVFITILIATVCWEGYWRWRGFVPTHKDDPMLWTMQRERLKTAGPRAVAVIGSSRIFYGLETDLVRERTGRPVVQLASNGMSPLPVLEDLAADGLFRGVVLCGLSIPTLFGHPKYDEKARNWIRASQRQTHLDRWNQWVLMRLEELFVYPAKEELFAQLMASFQILTSDEPRTLFWGSSTQLTIIDENRESYMPVYVEKNKSVREYIIGEQIREMGKPEAVSPEERARVIERVRAAVQRIQARGGKVVFIRYPAGGRIAELEARVWPRERYWDALAALPGVIGMHHADHAGLRGFVPPEDSHLTRSDRIKFTTALIELLKERGVF